MATKEIKASIKAKLKSAKSAISEKQYEKSLEICEEILSLDASCYHALVFAGLCSLELSHKQRSKEFYQKAIALSRDDPLAWKGLAGYYDRVVPQDVEECHYAISVYKQCLQLQQGEEQRVRAMKKKLVELHRRCGEEEEAYHLLCELVAADPEGEGLWEGMLSLLLSWKVVGTEGLDKLEEGLTVSGRHPEGLLLERRLKYARLLSTLFYHTSSEEEGQALFHRCKKLAETGGQACSELLANMLLCLNLCSYPFSPSVDLQLFCGQVSKGGGAGGGATKLCHAAVLLEGASKLRDALKMVEGEEEEEPVALCRALRGIVLFFMHNYKQSALDLTWCLDHMSLLPTFLQTVYRRNFRLYVFQCQWCTDEGSTGDVLAALRDLEAVCEELFVSDHVKPLMARIHIARGQLEEAELIVSCLQSPESTVRCLKAKLALAQEAPSAALEVLGTGERSGAEENCLMGLALWLRGEAKDRREGYRHFVKAASKDPFNWESFYHIGQFQECDVGDSGKAIQCYWKALEHAPGNRRTGQALADLLEGQGKEKEKELLTLYKGITSACSMQEAKWAWLRMGLLLKRRGDHKEALTSLFNAIKADPKDSHCWECVGEAYLARGSLTPALRTFSKALELNPGSLYCHTRVASISRDLGHFTDACSSYETALSLDPTYLPALKGLGDALVSQARVYLQSNRDGRAVEMVAKALPLLVRAAKLKPLYSCVWKSLGDACVCLVDVDVEQSPWKLALPQELHGDGSQAASKGDLLEAATKVYSQLVHLGTDSSAAWHDLGMCLYFRGREKTNTDEGEGQWEGLLRGSLEALQKAVSLSPSSAHHWCSLGAVATVMGPSYYGLAQHSFIKALQLNEHDAVTWTNLGALYLKTDRVKLANEAFNRAHSADPQYPPSWTGQGMVAQIVGNSFEALDHFRHSSELLFAPESCRCHAHWVCSSLCTLPLGKAVHPASGQLLPVTERAVLQARDGLEKLSTRADDAKALNLLGLLCEHEGLLSRAVHYFERAHDVLGRMKRTLDNTQHSVMTNLARVLAKRGTEDGCGQSVEVLTQQVPSSTWLGQAFLALALHRCGDGKEAEQAFVTAMSRCDQTDLASHLLVAQAMCVFVSDQHQSKPLLFQAVKSEPPSPFALLALMALAALLPDHTLLLAATEEALKVADGTFVLHPTFVDVLVSVMVMLIFDKEGEHCLVRVRELWIKLSQSSPDVHFATKADLVSVFEHLKSGRVREAQLSAAKYCHNHPGDPAELALLTVLQM